MDGLKDCPHCRGRGWILRTDSNGYEYAKACECQEVIKSETRLNASGITEEFKKKGFKDFDCRGMELLTRARYTAIQYCKKFPEIRWTRENSIMFQGQVGSGKTHLSMAVANALMTSYKVGVIYMPYREEITRLKQVIKNETAYSNALNRLKQAPVLMIDDLLKGKNTEADINILFDIINFRYLNTMPMIISTEKTNDEILDFDEGTMSRLIEMARGYRVEIKGREYNYRLR